MFSKLEYPQLKIIEINKGVILFDCTCSRKGFSYVRKFTPLSRCIGCTKVNNLFKNKVSKEDLDNLYEVMEPFILGEDIFISQQEFIDEK